MWLHTAKRSLQNQYLNHFVLPIDKCLTIKTFENKFIRLQTEETLLQNISRNIKLPSQKLLKKQVSRLKKSKNRLEKNATKQIKTETENKKSSDVIHILKNELENKIFFSPDHKIARFQIRKIPRVKKYKVLLSAIFFQHKETPYLQV